MIELIAILTAYITGRVVGEYQAKRQVSGRIARYKYLIQKGKEL